MTLSKQREECAGRGCGHDLASHYRDYQAEAARRAVDPKATGPITGDCLAMGCDCKKFEKKSR